MSRLLRTIGLVGAAAGVAYLSKSENRDKVKAQIEKITGAASEGSMDYLKKIGRPGAVGATDDAKMVDEGALTSVQYYNKLQEDEAEEK